MARYTDERRAEIVAMMIAEGWPDKKGAAYRVAQATGLHQQTITNWAKQAHNPPPQKVLNEKKESLKELFEKELRAIMSDMPGKRKDADYRTLATAAGILSDKVLRLEGKPSWHIEIVQLVQTGQFTIEQVEEEFGSDLVDELFKSNVSTSS